MGWLDDLYRTVMTNAGGDVVAEEDALPGRDEAIPVAPAHLVTGKPMVPPFPEGHESIVLGMGCFWGAERVMWQLDGVWTTAVGYAGGWTRNPTYEETCTGRTGHTEAVLVVYDPAVIGVEEILKEFFELHDPTQGMRQGNDVGSQYRSAVYVTTPRQLAVAEQMATAYQEELRNAGRGEMTTEFGMLADLRSGEFYYAEDIHQQYLVKVPNGYDCHARTGIACPLPQ